jgi:type IV pilus assembly protein PilM
VPSMSESDFRSALQFQAMELIPLPVDDAILDFLILPSSGVEPKGAGRMQILLAAAHRAVIDSYLGVLRDASLHAVALDPAPTAIVRATKRVGADTASSVAVVDLGADLTVIAVSESGRVRFSRILSRGGGDLTERLASRLTLGHAAAERWKRQVEDKAPGGVLLANEVDPLVSEIESSLSFFADQIGADSMGGTLLTGGGSGERELVRQLHRRLSGSVELVDALEGLDCANLDLDSAELATASSTALVAIGAAEWAFDQPSQRLSVLPIELAKAAAARRYAFAAAAGVAVLTAGVVGLSLHRFHETTTVKAQTAAVLVTNAKTQDQITSLAPVSSRLSAIGVRLADLQADQADDIAWSSVTGEITAAMPAGSVLSGLTLSDAPVANASTSVSLGTASMSVQATGTEEQVAVWLRAYSHLKGITDVSIPSGSVSGTAVTFQVTLNLTTGVATVNRVAGSGSSS